MTDKTARLFHDRTGRLRHYDPAKYHVTVVVEKTVTGAGSTSTTTTYSVKSKTIQKVTATSTTTVEDITFNNIYSPNQEYTFSKTWAGYEGGNPQTINVTVSNGTVSYTGNLTAVGGTLTANGGKTITLSGSNWEWTASLPTGTWTMTENSVGGKTVTSGTVVNGDAGEWRVTGSGRDITNTYWKYTTSTTSDTLTLTITKKGETGDANLTGAAFAVYTGATATGTPGGTLVASSTANTPDNGVYTITLDAADLADGSYTLYETQIPADHARGANTVFTVDVTAAAGAPVENSAAYTINTNTHTTAAITGLTGGNKAYTATVRNNAINYQLTLKKTVKVDGAVSHVLDSSSFTFKVYGQDSNNAYTVLKGTYTVPANEELVLTKKGTSGTTLASWLTGGSYKVVEEGMTGTSIGDYDWKSAGSDVEEIATLNRTVQSATAALTNNYTIKTGDLTITKTVEKENNRSEAVPEVTPDFTIVVKTGPNENNLTPYSGSYTVSGVAGTQSTRNGEITLTRGQTAAITGLPYDTRYEVRETAGNSEDAAGYINDTAAKAGTIGASNAVTVANTYFKSPMVTVSGSKTFVDGNNTPVTTLLPAQVTVQLYKDGSPVSDKTAALTDANGWAYDFGSLPMYDSADDTMANVYTVVETGVTYSDASVYGVEYIRQGGEPDGKIEAIKVLGTHSYQNQGDTVYEVLGVWTTTDGTASTGVINTWIPATDEGTGSLTIKKVSSANNSTTLSAEFQLKDSEGAIVKVDGKDTFRTDATTGQKTVSNLAPGTYTLTEITAPSGYDKGTQTSWTVKVAANKANEHSTLINVTEQSTNVFKNLWNWATGWLNADGQDTYGTLEIENAPIDYQLTLSKSVSGTTTGEKTFPISVYAKGPDGQKTGDALYTADLKAGQSIVLHANAGTDVTTGNELAAYGNAWLTAGSYIVEEAAGTYHTATHTWTGAAYSTAASVTLSDTDRTASVAVTNSYIPTITTDKEGLVISKTVTNKENDTTDFTFTVALDGTASAAYKVYVAGADETTAAPLSSGTITSAANTITLKDGQYARVTGINYGTSFTVAETANEAYTTTVSADDGVETNTANRTATGTISMDQKTAAVNYTNDYITGNFRIAKTDGTNAITGKTATFALYTDEAMEIRYDNGLTGDAKGTYTTDTATGIAQVQNLPKGTYYLQEVAAPDGYIASTDIWKVTVNTDKTVTVQVKNTTPVIGLFVAWNNVALTNSTLTVANTKIEAGLTITKAVDNSGASVTGQTFVFSIYDKTAYDAYLTAVETDPGAAAPEAVATMTATGTGPAVVTGSDPSSTTLTLEKGTYTIVETTVPASDASALYSWTGVDFDAAAEGKQSTRSVTVGEEQHGETIAVTATNYYERDTGYLVITKLLAADSEQVTIPAGTTFTVYDTKGTDSKADDTQVYFTQGTDGEGQPNGIYTYTADSAAEGAKGSFTYGEMTGNPYPMKAFKIEALPTGVYRVEETNANIKNYNLTTTVWGDQIGHDANGGIFAETATVRMPKAGEPIDNIFAVYNKYVKIFAEAKNTIVGDNFQIHKQAHDRNNDVETDNGIQKIYTDLSDVTFTLKNGTATVWTGTTDTDGLANVVIQGGTSEDPGDIPGGAAASVQVNDTKTYTLEETTPAGYAAAGPWTVTLICTAINDKESDDGWYKKYVWEVSSVVSAEESEETNLLEEGTATIINERTYGALTITKNVTGLSRTKAKGNTYTFSITADAAIRDDVKGKSFDAYDGTKNITVTFNNNGLATVSITVDESTGTDKKVTGTGSITIRDLPTGSYTVRETGGTSESGYNFSTSISNGGVVEVPSYQANETGAAVEVTNSYSTIPYHRDDDDDDDDDEDPVIIPDEDTPTVDFPEEPTVEIPEEPVPQDEYTDPGKTGDSLMAWILAAGVSGIGLVWLALAGKKRKDESAE